MDAEPSGPASSFLLEDVGDGWWDCPSPLRCTVIDGPLRPNNRAGDGGRFVLVETDSPVRHEASEAMAKRWGSDHPGARSHGPTNRLLVMSHDRWTGDLRLGRRGAEHSTVAYPMWDAPDSIVESAYGENEGRLGIKPGVLVDPLLEGEPPRA